jgi:uncharacterized protein
MIMDLAGFHKKAQNGAIQNKKFLDSLRKKNPRELDANFHDLHDEVFDEIDCLACANCCKTTSPIFTQNDIERIAKRLRMKPGDFIQRYLHIDEDRDFVLNSAPCPFLDHENYCTVYEDRPSACKEYPHTNRKRMHQLLSLAYKNTLVCPAVLEIVERMKKK